MRFIYICSYPIKAVLSYLILSSLLKTSWLIAWAVSSLNPQISSQFSFIPILLVNTLRFELLHAMWQMNLVLLERDYELSVLWPSPPLRKISKSKFWRQELRQWCTDILVTTLHEEMSTWWRVEAQVSCILSLPFMTYSQHFLRQGNDSQSLSVSTCYIQDGTSFHKKISKILPHMPIMYNS